MGHGDGNRWLPRAVFAAGMLYTLVLLSFVRGEVFYNGDAGLKALMTKQWARGIHATDLRLDAPTWVHELWEKGFYPFAPPFVYDRGGRHYIAFPLIFPIVSAPFYKVAGFRGLYVIPVASLWLVWFIVERIGRRQGLTPARRAWRLAALIFGSPLTLYGAMFWEHTLAVALTVTGIFLMAFHGGAAPRRRAMAAGATFLGVAAWIRPEMLAMLLGGSIPLAYALRTQPRAVSRWLALGLLVPTGALLAVNTAASGHPFGFHGLQVTHGFSIVQHLELALKLLVKLPLLFIGFFPLVFAVAVAWVTSRTRGRLSPQQVWSLIGCVVGLVALVCIIPNDGGRQWGPRYLLSLVPLVVVWDPGRARLARIHTPLTRDPTRMLLLVCFVAGVVLNTVWGTLHLARDYRARVLPALRHLEAEAAPVLAVHHQYVPQELEALLETHLVARTAGVDDLRRLAQALVARDITRFTYVCLSNRVMPGAIPLTTVRGRGQIVARPPVRRGWFLIYDARVYH